MQFYNKLNNMKSIVFAGGCFWGVQHYFKLVRGVRETAVGYIQGITQFPTYEQVCAGTTKHTEAVKILYDTEETHLLILLEHYFNIVDPTTLNRQAMDTGTQYRSGIYYYELEDADVINKYIDSIRNNYIDDIVVEVKPAGDFWDAEEYHQDYLEKNEDGYCHLNMSKYLSRDKVDKNARIKFNLMI
jgi:methionine-S-sulfoxide reductase